MGILTVHLDRITNLADEDHIGNSDPYVKVRVATAPKMRISARLFHMIII